MRDGALPTGRAHLAALFEALGSLEDDLEKIEGWGVHLARVLTGGGRLLAAGNGGSAALAEHLCGELSGRYRDDRRPLSALALHSDGASLTAIANDYGPRAVFSRLVAAHGRPGDVFLAISTSGESPNVLSAAQEALRQGLTVWAMTGRRPNPLAGQAHDALCADAGETATIQEVHQVAVHMLCAALDCRLGVSVPQRGEVAR